MKVALVHYWLVGMRGGEKVLEALCDLYPQADIFTLVADRSALSEKLLRHRITTSFLQKLGGVKHYQKMLPLMPFALESFDLTGYDLVISSEAGPAKGIVPGPGATHVCYCHSPMRYIWDLYPEYRRASGALTRAAMSVTAPILRQWDVTTSHRVDHFIANSRYVAQRINKYYRREASVIHPPVDLARFKASDTLGDYYLCAGQITPYKRVEIAVEACTRLGRKLVVLGSGASEQLKRMAGPTVSFVGRVSDAEMARHFSECKALLFPGVEDFGIIPLEVMASGRPVIAYARGGATETVIDGKTGILFEAQTADSLMAAIERFEGEAAFSPQALQDHARQFDTSVFLRCLAAFFDGIGRPGAATLSPEPEGAARPAA
ncbi:Glycosyltransferase involved in cell wall bisynthesis [Pseudoxanthomonas sp. GM95]|uniref:glycosyltransferase n=1 Tax=Pseudoxanthomonas sp. GM95 TaxID=1881043 RepID=UPI0008CFD6A7|nr:glycosyltransferase [Pseudoxanthomonas sp. GM95]SEM45205.1 Glycosyltransferase involved in cell wall bisynthesis [Pseudoxanthomonas sp. GM95]